MKLLGINCLASTYYRDHRDDTRIAYRVRSDVWLRFWSGDREYIEGFNAAIAKLAALGVDAAPLTRQPPEAFDLFAWHPHSDACNAFVDIDGFPLSAVDLDGTRWEDVRQQFPALPQRSVCDVLQDMLEVDALLRARNVRRLIVPLDATRCPAEGLRNHYQIMNADAIAVMVPIGWSVYPVPGDAPPNADGAWTHYDWDWTGTFVARLLEHAHWTRAWSAR